MRFKTNLCAEFRWHRNPSGEFTCVLCGSPSPARAVDAVLRNEHKVEYGRLCVKCMVTCVVEGKLFARTPSRRGTKWYNMDALWPIEIEGRLLRLLDQLCESLEMGLTC